MNTNHRIEIDQYINQSNHKNTLSHTYKRKVEAEYNVCTNHFCDNQKHRFYPVKHLIQFLKLMKQVELLMFHKTKLELSVSFPFPI